MVEKKNYYKNVGELSTKQEISDPGQSVENTGRREREERGARCSIQDVQMRVDQRNHVTKIVLYIDNRVGVKIFQTEGTCIQADTGVCIENQVDRFTLMC